MDPNIAAIMARIDSRGPRSGSSSPATVATQRSGAPKPPLTYEEFMLAEKLTEWPQRLTSEGLLDLDQDRALIGTQDDLYQELKKATHMHFLQQLEDRLQALTGQLEMFADNIVVPPVQETLDRVASDGQSLSPSGLELVLCDPANLAPKKDMETKTAGSQLKKAFLTDLTDSDMLKVHPSRKGKKASNFKESLLETKRRGIESCVFPGFRKGELTELPPQLEAPQILNRVTKAQDFNPGFKKFWKKIFQSEASVAVMQDTFWWIFLRKFQPRQQRVQDQLFNRIADSFVALFTSINPEVKDKFFQVYSDCLAQALCAAYYEAFPESLRHFNDHFKQELVNITSEWVSGFCPPPGTWQNWRLDRLEPKNNKMADDGKTAATKSILDAAAVKEEKNTLEIDDFMRMVNKLGEQGNASSRVGTAIAPNNSRDISKLASVVSVAPAGMGLNQMTISRQAVCGTPRRQPEESHTVGPGPDIERVLFNLKGQSPLVAHYLRMRQLKDKPMKGRRVRRTQVSKQKGETTTYRQLINETMAFSETLSKEYQKICEQTNTDIAKIERQQRDINADIERLKRDLVNTKNPTDLKIFSERILDKREQAVAARQVTKNGQVKMDMPGSDVPHTVTTQEEGSAL